MVFSTNVAASAQSKPALGNGRGAGAEAGTAAACGVAATGVGAGASDPKSGASGKRLAASIILIAMGVSPSVITLNPRASLSGSAQKRTGAATLSVLK